MLNLHYDLNGKNLGCYTAFQESHPQMMLTVRYCFQPFLQSLVQNYGAYNGKSRDFNFK